MLKILIISVFVAFGLTGCVAPYKVEHNPAIAKEFISQETNKVKSISIQIKEKSAPLLERKINNFSIGQGLEYSPRKINTDISINVFKKYFDTVGLDSGDIVIETNIYDFLIEKQMGLLTGNTLTTTKLHVKVIYKDKVILDKNYEDKTVVKFISTKDDAIFASMKAGEVIISNSLHFNLINIYHDMLVPDMIKALKESKLAHLFM